MIATDGDSWLFFCDCSLYNNCVRVIIGNKRANNNLMRLEKDDKAERRKSEFIPPSCRNYESNVVMTQVETLSPHVMGQDDRKPKRMP
jgi:hypothetical protein